MPDFPEILDSLRVRLDRSLDILREAVAAGPAPAFSTSLGAEDQVLLDLISRSGLTVEVFTLDTGRLHPETHALLAETEVHFQRRIQVYFPNQVEVEDYVRVNGINGFFESRSQRLSCCDIRKLEPLRRALQGRTAWITGLRRGQSVGRSEVVELEMDSTWGLVKANPLAAWTEDDVWAYLRAYGIPTNPLHGRGYPSIGCAPCTRAIGPGEDIRAGRWWWENDEKKECGLHVRQS
ncbi:CysH 3'-phosphoadenosine 5'-phosphosulfate sulfotransferase (PAPS reductase)/FAD synthetase and related enzymes [Burkholderiales bacterium]